MKEVKNFYGRMMRALGRKRLYRSAAQTPLEFARTLQHLPPCIVDDIRFITERFFSVRYGQAELLPAMRTAIEQAIKRLGK